MTQDWAGYVSTGYLGDDEPHLEFDELVAEAEETDDPRLRALVDEWRERRRHDALARYMDDARWSRGED
ncbi:hypothetical protein FW320_00415 [Azospirillum sp. Vi22]|uniref:hypothetical protein n=1 Tax=Azospirillum baldaniorum TaxID=1064539 RepID=UPI00157A5AC4|nr:hypothetical protein [Azospirillum baldaniorum]NUB04658.1 hypothetical protein [Azospirillum baldaniorum]